MISWGTARNFSNRTPLDLQLELDIPLEFCPLSGSISHIYGPNNSGRTKFCIAAARAASIDGFTTIYFPAKMEFMPQYVADIERFFIVQTGHIGQAFQVIREILNIKNERKYIFIIDDLSAMRAEFETDYKSMNLRKYVDEINTLLRLVMGDLAQKDCYLLMTTQMRAQISQGKIRTQIRFLDYLCDFIYDLRIVEKTSDGPLYGIKVQNNISHEQDTFYSFMNTGGV
jgi:RecA/RadA recombinase